MLCARVMRGRSSSANATSFASRILATPSRLRLAFMRATTTVPGFIWAISSGFGGWTLRTTADVPNTWERSESTWAPAAVYAASGYREAAPAPASTTTSTPAFVRCWTTSGTRATRFSPGLTSVGTPIRTVMKIEQEFGRGDYTLDVSVG